MPTPINPMNRKRLHILLLLPLLLVFGFSTMQAGETVLCVSDAQTHYVKRNPLRMMACHAETGDREAGGRHMRLDTSSCTEILLASAYSILHPEEPELLKGLPAFHPWPAADIAIPARPVSSRPRNASLPDNSRNPSLLNLRTIVLLI